MTEQSTERRHFHRIATDKPVVVHANRVEHKGMVLDLSLRGLLLQADDEWQPDKGTQVHAHIDLDDESFCIDIDGAIAHVDGRRIGVHVTGIDVESATRLRRMVELNLANEDLMERDLAQLINS